MVVKILAFCAVFGMLAPMAAVAEGRETIGTARHFTNDFLGDGRDRWRTGSYLFSLLRGPEAVTERPDRLGPVIEYRLRSEIIAPLGGSTTQDARPYVGMLSAGVHFPVQLGPVEASIGGDIILIGPQTGLSDFQQSVHDRLDMPPPVGVDTQLPNDVLWSGTADLAWPIALSETVTVRPFFEVQAGAEDLLRVGADVTFGAVFDNGLLVRAPVTGQHVPLNSKRTAGIGFLVGVDAARVFDTAYLPADRGLTAEDVRYRARIGTHWQMSETASVFYGLTYLSPEVVGQSEGQVLGGLSVNFKF